MRYEAGQRLRRPCNSQHGAGYPTGNKFILTTVGKMYSIANWNPPPEYCQLLAEGRKLAYCKKFEDAVHFFQRSIATNSDASVALTFLPPWSRNVMITAARLFLMKICWSNKDAAGAQKQAEKLQHSISEITDVKMKVHCCWVVAQVCRSIAEKSSVADKRRQAVLTGISACRSVLPYRKILRHLHERARFLDLESSLHALNCTCPELECQCGSLAMATRRLEECIECHMNADRGSTSAVLSKVKRNSKKNFHLKPKKCDHQWKQPNQPTALMRRRRDRLKFLISRLPKAAKRAREIEKTATAAQAEKAMVDEINRERGRRRKKKKRVKLANCLNDKLQELASSVRARLPFVEGMCKCRDLIDWDVVPPALRPSSSGAGGLAPARAARKRGQLESLYTVLLRLVACTEARLPPAPLYTRASPSIASSALSVPSPASFVGPIITSTASIRTTAEVAAATQCPPAARPRVHVVDFGAGTGNSLLPLAALLKSRLRVWCSPQPAIHNHTRSETTRLH